MKTYRLIPAGKGIILGSQVIPTKKRPTLGSLSAKNATRLRKQPRTVAGFITRVFNENPAGSYRITLLFTSRGYRRKV